MIYENKKFFTQQIIKKMIDKKKSKK